jgi:excisionase family DNA binding protein
MVAKALSFTPIGMRIADAARFVGVSETTFREWVRRGLMPSPRRIGDCVMWDTDELKEHFRALPREGAPANDDWVGVAL